MLEISEAARYPKCHNDIVFRYFVRGADPTEKCVLSDEQPDHFGDHDCCAFWNCGHEWYEET